MTDSTEPTEALDVRSWVPIDRHTHLLRLFKELPVGQSFVFINDHDPLPLCYEFRSVHGDVVGWEYLKRGGTDWKVKVTRTEASRGREFTDIQLWQARTCLLRSVQISLGAEPTRLESL